VQLDVLKYVVVLIMEMMEISIIMMGIIMGITRIMGIINIKTLKMKIVL
jgi:hypothetical protein